MPSACGIRLAYTTRLAGFETGSTKLAALAISAQANKCGKGRLSWAVLAAASTAGVSTTAVASLDMKVVTTMPTPYTMQNSRLAEPWARRTACAAIQSNRPVVRAISAISIMPVKNR